MLEAPQMGEAREVAMDSVVLPSGLNVPGYGYLMVNAFLVKAAEPVLVDTGLRPLEGPFMEALRAHIEPSEIRWIWITHADPDHIGNLAAVMREAPQARVATPFIGMAKMLISGLPVQDAFIIEPGAGLDVGDRVLQPFKPPYYDAPETTGIFDPSTRVLYSADCLGALLQKAARDAGDIDEAELHNGLLAWSSVDSPWLNMTDPARMARAFDEVRDLGAQTLLSSHLPPATGMIDKLLDWLREAYVEARVSA